MRVVHDNFVTLPVNARELALAVQNGEELNNLLFCITTVQGDMLPNMLPLSLTSIVEKTGMDPGTLPQLRWSSMWQGCLICF